MHDVYKDTKKGGVNAQKTSKRASEAGYFMAFYFMNFVKVVPLLYTHTCMEIKATFACGANIPIYRYIH